MNAAPLDGAAKVLPETPEGYQMPRTDRWVTPSNWSRFQHYRTRRPPWIKLYLDLLHRAEWVDMTPFDQSLLVNVWLLFAESNGQLRVVDVVHAINPGRYSPKRHHERITRGLARLNHAGFVAVVASKPLSLKPLDVHARARGANGRSAPCEFCEVGGGHHTADCPTLKGATT